MTVTSPKMHTRSPWRAEIRAMLLLAWPMILTNLG
jgi:Na+-driven multidrug efflux pump